MRRLIRNHKLGFILTLVGVLGMAILAAPSVLANHAGCGNFYNRCASHGYFTGKPYVPSGTYVMSTGRPKGEDSRGGMPVYNVNEFVCRIYALLYDGNPPDKCPAISTPNKYQDTTGAAFIVNTMLGRWGTDYSSRDQGVIWARANFTEWENRVRWYDSQGLIEWDRKYSYNIGFENSLYDSDIGDDLYIYHQEYQAEYTIMIHAPGHGPNSGDPWREFQIKKNCGNPIGANYALKPVPQPPPPPPPPPPVTIRGRVFNYPGQLGAGGIANVRIYGCEAGFDNTDANGFFEFTVPRGSGFCLRVHSGAPPNSVGPYIRPWSEGVPGQSPGCPGFGTSTSSPTVNHSGGNRNYCAQAGYECQTAGVHQKNAGCPSAPFMDRNWDEGYDIAYRPDSPPLIEASAQCPVVSPPNGQVRVTTLSDADGPIPLLRYRSRVNGGAWSNYTNANNPTVPFSVPNMASRDRYDVHTFEFVTRGAGPHGGEGAVERTVSVNFGLNANSPTRACEDRDFTVTPNAGPTALLPDTETATGASFASGASVTFTQPGGPGNVNGVTYTRRYFILKADGTTIELNAAPRTPRPSGTNPRVIQVPFTLTPLDSGNLNPAVAIGDQVCQIITIRPKEGKIDTVGTIVDNKGNVSEATSQVCSKVVAKPYFRAYSGDVFAGSTPGCFGWGYNPDAQLSSWWHTTTKKGAGTQLAAFALNNINEFASATGRTSDPKSPKALSFANTSGTYGGNFKSGSCAHDYIAEGAKAANKITAVSVNLGTMTQPGSYRKTGDLTLRGSLASKQKVTLYVDGNVFIDNNVTYSSTNNWNGINDIPSFSLIVYGNIYIAPNVTNLDGLYVAQPSDDPPPVSRGQIVTCAPSISSLPDEAQLIGACKNQLTVNGAFIAKRVRLLRTYGSMKDSCPSEPRGVPAPAASPPPCPTSKMAERFIFTPEAWMNSSIEPGSNSTLFEAITSLPPVL